MEYPFRLSGKQFSLLLTITLILIAGYVLRDFLLFEKLYLFPDTGGDSYLQFYPWLVMVSDYLYSHGLPTWSFKVGLGQNIFPADLNNPFRLVLILLGREYLHLAIAYVELVKFVLAGWLFYKVGRLQGLEPLAAGMGAVLFANTGYLILGSSWHGHSALVVFGIFYVFAFEKLFVEKVWVYFPIAVFLILSRSPFYLYFLSLFLSIYAMVRLHTDRDTDWRFSALVLTLALFGGLGIVLSAWFTLSDVHRILASPRLSGGVGLFDLLSASTAFQLVSSGELLTTVYRSFSTDLMGTGDQFKGWYNYLEAPNFYAGVISLLILPQLFFVKPDRRTIFLLIVVVVLLVLLFPFFRYSLYLFSGNYYKGGLSFVFGFGLVLSSALVYSEILKGKQLNQLGLLMTAAALLTVLFFPFENVEERVNNLRFLVAAFIVLYTILLSVGRRYPTAKYWLLVVIIAEAGWFSSITVNDRYPLTLAEFDSKGGYKDGSASAVQRLKEQDDTIFRVEKFYNSVTGSLNEGQFQDYFATSSYHQFNHPAYIRFYTTMGHLGYPVNEVSTRWVGPVSGRPFLQSLLGVKYLLHDTELTEAKYSYASELTKVEGEPITYLNNLWLPLAFVYDRSINIENFFELSAECQDSLLLVAYISESAETESNGRPLSHCPDSEFVKRAIEKKRLGALEITEFNEAALEGEIKLNDPGVLFFSIPYDVGWYLEVDGKERELMMINFGFLGVKLEPGEHHVALRYEPPSFVWGFILSASAFILLVLAASLSAGSCTRLQRHFQR